MTEDVRTYLDVPFPEKDRAKALGAKWDAGRRRWWVDLDEVSRDAVAAWLPAVAPRRSPGTAAVSVSLLGLTAGCWKCHRPTTSVVGFLPVKSKDVDNMLVCRDEDVLRHTLGLLTDDVRAATSTGVVKSRYSHTEKRSYLANGCFHCDALLGNFHIYYRELREAIARDELVTIARGAVGWSAIRDFLVPDNTWAGAVLHYDPLASFFDGRLHGPLNGKSWEFDLSEWQPPLGGRPR